MADPYTCRICGGDVDKKGFCSDCGAPACGICPECGEHKPDDDRVKAGMKCSECAGYGLMEAFERDRMDEAEGREPADVPPEHL